MTPVELSRTVLRAVRRAVDEGELRVAVPERAVVTVPGPGGCGDYATNIALQLARPAGHTPQRVAEILRPHLLGADGVDDVVVTGPGFINFCLTGSTPTALVEDILRCGPRYGFADGPSGQVVQLHCPREVRAVVVMDAVARILRSQGALVRTRCEARPEPLWQDVLGVGIDAYGRPAAHGPAPLDVDVRPVPAPLDVDIRPVPAPGDPVPLGADAARWALLHPAAHDRPRVTDEHLVQRESNPLFRVRYAHARIRATTRNAADLGFTSEPGPAPASHAADLGVLTPLADHPRILAAAATHRAPDRLARHLVTVADAVLVLLPAVLPRGAEKPSVAHRARLALAEAAGAVLAGGLSLLGIDAPEHI
ncbi:ArgS-related anticodon-binding protein NrtL [Streptomyces sp. YS415]|uniref:ArgS-related anticodon-binding protein NrtL n=1 Tax=Streptomyces sp. YS415 TaxID=2944806 RepID=UPI002020A772|nr:DALR anticodon-binding domain-containing protein [Streptomyces sp. YS415]MCL7427374.1 DALR anticodon-binding domain-containing protein [Streptomyces sp. YS415]